LIKAVGRLLAGGRYVSPALAEILASDLNADVGMRTSEAVTPMPGLVASLVAVTTVYIALAVIVAALIRRQVIATHP
jgi:hypothetical protein